MYDPLHDASPGIGEVYPESYWAKTSGEAPQNAGKLNRDISTDVVIIGAGYTGMSCALHLARYHGIHAHVLEANQTAWGCSGRNAGFILKSSGRMAFSVMEKRWGKQVMHAVHDEMAQGVDLVNSLIAEGINCDKQELGYLKVAHKPEKLNTLIAQAKLQQQRFGSQIEVLTKAQVRADYMDDKNAFGAIRFHDGFGVNPLKLAWGYQSLAQQAGAYIHTSSPVTSWQKVDGGYQLNTPEGTIKAKKIVLATNGYTPKSFHSIVNARTLPVLSQIIVTEPLTQQQLDSTNIKTTQVVMDTRALKYYYRKLPDNRILFGGRGAITGKGANDPYYTERLLAVLKSSFPSLQSLRIAYAWSGWICMSLDDIPHIYHNDEQDVFYAMGYCGAGVSFSAQAGKRLAERVAGKELPAIPLYQTQLPKFPFAPLRRLGQWSYFQYGKFADKYL